MPIRSILVTLSVLLLCSLDAATYWVSPTGAATWVNAASETPLSGAACASMATANANAAAGDVVYLTTGTYSTLTGVGVINPSNSGTSGNVIHFTAAPGAEPVIAPTEYWSILITAKDYIKISGLTFTGPGVFFRLGNGADYNEIYNCTFTDAGDQYYSSGLITNTTTGGTGGNGSTHNWIHSCTFTRYGSVESCADSGTIRIAADPTETYGEDASYYNTFEDCVFSYGGHDCFDLGGRYNVIRNNTFHNEEAFFEDTTGTCTNSPASGYFGNRNLIVSGYTNTDRNLIEGNRAGHAGTPPDDDGAMGIENAGDRMIIRYNMVFGNGATGIYLKNQSTQRPDNNRIYNNTIFSNGYGDPDLGFKSGTMMSLWDYVNVSNDGETYRCILAHWTADDKEPGVSAGWETYWAVGALAGARTLDWTTYKGQYYDTELRPKGNIFINNIVYGNLVEQSITTTGGLNTYTNNLNTDPSFVDDDLTDKTSLVLPNLSITVGSSAIDGGDPLTTVAVADTGSGTTLVVADALYFQDGTWGSSLSDIQPDFIAVGTVANQVQISSIDYATNTITLAGGISRSDGDSVWLAKDSDGTVVLLGDAPDQGAYEFGSGLSDATVTTLNVGTLTIGTP